MSLMQKILGLRKNIMSYRSEIHSLRKSHNVTPPEISGSVRKLKKSNGTGRRFPLFVKKDMPVAGDALTRDFAEVLHRVQRPQHQKVNRIVDIEEIFMKLPVGRRLLTVIEVCDAHEAQHHAECLR